ncbi:MAG: DNA helicase [Armatimonadota bacterium]|nr:MAG: DNA helicase [Armatimonadota bacterium]
MRLTDEQVAIIEHPIGCHARVLAVAGSGKTSTMVKRIRYLFEHHHVTPDQIQVLMFNRLAKEQFVYRLASEEVPYHESVPVNTFHSAAYAIYGHLVKNGILPNPDYWIADREEMSISRIRRAVGMINAKYNLYGNNMLDVEEARESISLWKASMIPPERAGHKYNPYYAEVYAEYEKLRTQANGVTFDDMLLTVVRILESNSELRERYVRHVRFLIVDEYQDVNYVQQRLIELLSNGQADIMVVGDDDQTIYEWRGARIEYIRNFPQIFNDRPCKDYTLTRSFRFGPIIAQCAHNVIHNNKQRHPKKVVANSISAEGNIYVTASNQSQVSSTIDQFVSLIVARVAESGGPAPNNEGCRPVVVLGRTWAQLVTIESAFLKHKIPYCLIGQMPFIERHETQRMIEYLVLSINFKSPVNDRLIRMTQNVLNFPRRFISKEFRDEARHIMSGKQTLADALSSLVHSAPHPRVQQRLKEMYEVIGYINDRIRAEQPISASNALSLITERFNLNEYFRDFYGRSEASESRMMTLQSLIFLAQSTGLGVPEFVEYVRQLDPTQGKPEDECIPVTTIFQTKGLEFDYVFIPSAIDGFMPVRRDNENPCYDTAGIVKEPEISAWDESERRLFYVGITRARKGVYIMSTDTAGDAQHGMDNIRKIVPSPYIAEMLHKPTAAIMNSLQRIAAEQTADPAVLTTHYDKYGNPEPVTQMLLDYYLPELGLPGIAEAVRKKAEEVKQRKVEEKPTPPPKREKKWWEEMLEGILGR